CRRVGQTGCSCRRQSGAGRYDRASMDKNDSMDLLASRRRMVRLFSRGHGMVKARAGGACPVAAFQKLISGKYKLRIVWDLKDGPRRYGEIRSGLLRVLAGSAQIAPRVLSRELKALAESALIDGEGFRHPAAESRVPPDPQGP